MFINLENTYIEKRQPSTKCFQWLRDSIEWRKQNIFTSGRDFKPSSKGHRILIILIIKHEIISMSSAHGIIKENKMYSYHI